MSGHEYAATIEQRHRWGPEAWHASVTYGSLDVGTVFAWIEASAERQVRRLIERRRRESELRARTRRVVS